MTTLTPTIDDEALTAAATALTDAFGLGDEIQVSTWWPGDDEDTVIACPFSGAAEGEILLAVSADVGERLLSDRPRFVAGLQRAADDALEGLSVSQDIELVRRRAANFAIISDRNEPCAIFAMTITGGAKLDVERTTPGGPRTSAEVASTVDDARGAATRDTLFARHGRLLDVDVTVAVELGRTTWTMAQLLDLQVGKIIELDRDVDLPVSMTADGTEIAQGHVVVVNQNFGLRLL